LEPKEKDMGNSFSGAGAAGAIVESGTVKPQAPAATQPTTPESPRAPERRES
jgi:hypothetical protein